MMVAMMAAVMVAVMAAVMVPKNETRLALRADSWPALTHGLSPPSAGVMVAVMAAVMAAVMVAVMVQ